MALASESTGTTFEDKASDTGIRLFCRYERIKAISLNAVSIEFVK